MPSAIAPAEPVFTRCALLLQELHKLIAAGRDDGEEAELLRAQIDPLWWEMTEEERERLGGLSEDLYILAEGGARRKAMTAEEKTQWTQEANRILPRMFAGRDLDAALKFLRQPIPDDRPPYLVPFLQARCWEKLGESDLALLFMKETARLDPRQAVCVLLLLEKLERRTEVVEYAERIVANPKSSAEELFQAAAAFLRPARALRLAEARPILQRIAPILERALTVFVTTPKAEREVADGDRYILTMLGYCHEYLGNKQLAVQTYNEGLARYPGDATLLTFRALALLDDDLPRALDDFRRAAQAGALLLWPYYVLAWDAIQRKNYAEAWRLCLLALERPGGSARETAQLIEWLGIALTELGQATGWVRDNFRKAEELDPDNDRIRRNREIAEALRESSSHGKRESWVVTGKPSGEKAQRVVCPLSEAAPDLFVERADSSLAALLQPA